MTALSANLVTSEDYRKHEITMASQNKPDELAAMRFVVGNLVEGLAPSNNPLISPLGWKALIDTGGLSAARGATAFARDLLSKPRVAAMVEPGVGQPARQPEGVVSNGSGRRRGSSALAGLGPKVADSWWSDYVSWLGERSGSEIDTPKPLGGDGFPPLGPAPGSYVMEK